MASLSSAAIPYPTPDNSATTARVLPFHPVMSRPIQAPHLQNFFAKRHRKILQNNLPAAFNKPTIRRLARRGGVKRIKTEIYSTVQQVMRARLEEIVRLACIMVESKHQKTMTALDVVYALQVLGNPIYGCSVIYRGENVNSRAGYMRARRTQQAQNVQDTQERLERERQNRLIDVRVRRLGGSVNLRHR